MSPGLMVIIVGFNLFFSPLVPLTDALANTWQKQITMDYGRRASVGIDSFRHWFGANREAGQACMTTG
ncbi:3-phenylpropionic acid transporter [Klebsiella oxytoca]|nr:3-phenylpropionic acid transporter [Klebsiella oxytoca]